VLQKKDGDTSSIIDLSTDYKDKETKDDKHELENDDDKWLFSGG
jgi:hypothetical protein